eukprot:1360639-Amorphochlora_amoeboformis.AAC.1
MDDVCACGWSILMVETQTVDGCAWMSYPQWLMVTICGWNHPHTQTSAHATIHTHGHPHAIHMPSTYNLQPFGSCTHTQSSTVWDSQTVIVVCEMVDGSVCGWTMANGQCNCVSTLVVAVDSLSRLRHHHMSSRKCLRYYHSSPTHINPPVHKQQQKE